MDEKEILETMSKYTFYHTIKLTDTISTPGHTNYEAGQNICLNAMKNIDFKGKRVLDIGCRDGLFSFAAESMGAAEIIGIDNDISKAAIEFLIPFLKSKVQMSEINVYDLTYKSFGKFDIIIFPGVLYHLRYPFWALKVIREVLNEGGYLITETPIWRAEKKNAILFCPIEGASPYEPTSCTFFNEKGMVDTLKSIGFKTINIEYVPVAHPIKRAIRNFKAYLRTVLARGNRPPIRRVERCAFLSQYLGVDMNSEIMKYWEDIHKIHSGGHV